MIAEAVVALLVLASGAAALLAALGLWRLPDFFLRMHAPAVCTTLGINPNKQNNTPNGRPIRIVDKGFKPITQLL